jgi:iron complex outermembrane recepter protein
MLYLKRNMLSVALVSAIMATAISARAQSTDEATDQTSADAEAAAKKEAAEKDAKTLETVRVSGIRAGIESAIEVKRDSNLIVEVISAEDLGKLPDVSIADSISRLTGLAAQRVAGRASTVSIRGLSGDFGTTLMNGREQVSVGDNRTVEFDQFPAELINQVVVYKTPDASLVGQGLSGTIDLRTVRPLSFQERVVSLNARGEKNSLGKVNADSDDLGSRVSAFYVDQFMDDKLGIALGYARLDSPGQAQRWESWGYPDGVSGADGNYVLGGAKVQGTSTSNVRQGLMGVLEFNASEHYNTMLDVYYSKFDKAETTRFMETPLGWSGASLQNANAQNGVITSGTFTNVRPVLRNDLNEGNDKLFAIGWNNHFTLSYDWTADIDVSHSRADRNESILEMYAGTRAGVTDTVDFQWDRTGFPTFDYGLDYTDPNIIVLTDPGGWGQDGYIKTPQIKDQLTSFRASAERAFNGGPFSSMEFGINYADREKQRSVPEAFLDLINDETTVPGNFLLSPVDLGFAGVPGSLSYQINPVLAQFYTLRDNINSDIVNKQWKINEKVTTGYAQINISTDLGSVPVRGNIGVQAVSVDQSSDGFSVLQGDAANAIPFSGGATYTDYLPSLNLAFQLPADNTLRLSLGRQAARPRLDQLRANNNTSLTLTGQEAGRWIRDGGNPELKPWLANAFDLSFEHYFDKRGYFSAAYFYKDLQTYVKPEQGTFDATGLPVPAGYTGEVLPVGYYTRPVNANGGWISGVEFTVSVPFDMFMPALEGFGFVANYSNTRSAIKLEPDEPSISVPGLSRVVRNVSFYYEDHGFQARISQRSRSNFLGEVQGFGADRAPRLIDGDSVLDFQTGYTFSDESAMHGATILFQINNLTNEQYREIFPGNLLTQRTEKYGRQYLLGVTYKF